MTVRGFREGHFKHFDMSAKISQIRLVVAGDKDAGIKTGTCHRGRIDRAPQVDLGLIPIDARCP
jgi:hypothetical protein